MKRLHQTEDRVQQLKPDIETPAAMDSRILMDAYKAMDKAQSQAQTAENSGRINFRRLLMKNTVKYTAAAIILIAATLSLTLFNTSAYALEQTIKACHSVRSIHLREYHPGHDQPILTWAEFHPNGQPKRFRLTVPEWDSPQDGEKNAIWSDGAASIWFKKKNTLMTISEHEIAEKMLLGIRQTDPRNFLTQIQELHQDGKAALEIVQPTDKSRPIELTIDFDPPQPLLGHQAVALVDQATKLLTSIQIFELTGDEFREKVTLEFYDYNQAIAPAMFEFDNLPDDILKVDQVTQQIGLAQGEMPNNKVAEEVVRQFWQAVIDKDFDKAGQLYEGIPADKIRQAFGKFSGSETEIVSVGPAEPHPTPETGGLIVPCTLKVIKNGISEEITLDKIGVRPVFNQPGYWTIFGGL